MQYQNCEYEYQYNALFDYAAAAKLDFMISAIGTYGFALDREQKKKHLEKFKGIPTICVAAEVDGYDNIMFDNTSGVKQAIAFLAQKQHRRHIGIMAGATNNYECMERFRAYREALEENGLEFKESYYMPCSLSEWVTAEIEQLILNNPELDAIICANDVIATSVYKVMNKLNKCVGNDIAVVGFDDQPFAEKLTPPLASIRADAAKLGEAAVKKAVDILNHNENFQSRVPTVFIPRQSVCENTDMYEFFSKQLFKASKKDIDDNISNLINSRISDENKFETSKLIDLINEKFLDKKATETDFKEIVIKAENLFKGNSEIIDNTAKINAVVDCGYQHLFENALKENKDFVMKLYTVLYKLIFANIVTEYYTLEKRLEKKISGDNLFVRDMIMIIDGLDNSYARMLRHLVTIGASTSFVYIFSEPMIYHFGDTIPDCIEWQFVSYAYGEKTYTVPKTEQKIKTPQMFNNKYLRSDRRHTLIAADLFSAEYQYGVVLCEPETYEFFEELELVTYQISSTVKMLYMRKEQEKILNELYNKNLALKNMSSIDELTGIFNRRGFYNNAAQMIDAPENEGITYMICYADMDGLKTVNDKYGHAEGDYSIKALAKCLTELFGKTAIVGRMGGDEFAVIVPRKDIGQTEELTARRNQIIAELNENSAKPYPINMSIGIVECKCVDSYDLKTYIEKADGLLYNEKSERKRSSVQH